MNAIESDKYRITRDALKKDPIILKMVEELRELAEWQQRSCDSIKREISSESGTPTWEFMRSALDGYHERGGQVPTHIGGPAEVILDLLGDKS